MASGQAGFTLIELIVVFAILGLVLALMIGRVNGPSAGLTLRAAANELAAGLREARSAAIAANRSAQIDLDLAHRTWTGADGATRSLPQNAEVTVTSPVGQSRGREDAVIRFEGDGSSTGGKIHLAEGKRRIDVGVDWITGRVWIGDAQ